jgi:DNA polymerase III subunit gamma/tau
MLGLSDRGAVRSLLALLLAGDAPGALAAMRAQYDLGVEPSAILRGLLEAVHGITRAKVGGGADPAQSNEEREAYADWASRLGFAAVHRLWQLLLKGLSEVHSAPMPLEAAEMALLRVIHASDLPDPGDLAGRILSGGAAPAPSPQAAPASAAGPAPMLKAPAEFSGLVDLLAAHGKPHLAQQLHDYVGLVRYAPPELVVRPSKPLSGDFLRDLAAALKALTGESWRVAASDEAAAPSLLDQERQAAEQVRHSVLESPLVKAAFDAFPEAELTGFTRHEQRSA